MSEPKHRCIFCGKAGRRSKEHVFPQWLGKALSTQTGRARHLIAHKGEELSSGKLERPGAMFSQTLRVVCKLCNETWMAQIQDRAIPILIRLIKGEWPTLNQDEQCALATWVSVQTCVYEFADPKTAVIPQEHRTHLYTERSPPPDWTIWIGLCGSNGEAFGTHANHHGATFSVDATQSKEMHLFHTTGFTFGNLLIQSMMETPPGLFYPELLDFENRFSLHQIYPFKSTVHSTPSVTHDVEGFYRISNQLASTLGLQCYRLP